MKKISYEKRELTKKRQQRVLREQQRTANLRHHRKHTFSNFRRKHEEYFHLKENRQRFRSQHYRRSYQAAPATILIDGEFGIEDTTAIEYFLDRSNEIIDFDNRDLTIDLKNCTRVWPSAITLLCSLMQWVELSAPESQRPRLSSIRPSSSKVNSYLGHCGFYDYVHAKDPVEKEENYYPEKEIVKIEREKKLSNIEPREDKIISLLNQFSIFDLPQIELFNSIVLTEAFNNVTEHGVSHRDKGWWLLAQYHRQHKIISLSIADNGIGIRNTLMTGPQAADIEKQLANHPENDGKFIKMAIEETVSGALAAPLKIAGGYFASKKYAKGAHRGNGLKRITVACKKLKIPFTILSHHGYAFLDADGNIIKNGSMQRRVFAGTLYHLSIPAKGEDHNANN